MINDGEFVAWKFGIIHDGPGKMQRENRKGEQKVWQGGETSKSPTSF
jgi:hypothetical protein